MSWQGRFVLGVLAAGAVVVGAPGVLASPRVQLERCIGLDRFELARAVERELAASAASLQASGLIVSASCADGVTATVRVTEAGSARVVERTLALGEVAAELRPRLLALVAVELVESWIAAPPGAGEPERIASPGTAPPALVAVTPAASAPPPSPATSAFRTAEPMERGGRAIDVDLGARIYLETPNPLLQLAVEVELPWLAVGAVGAIGSALAPESEVPTFSGGYETELGRFHPYLLGLAARRSIDCLRTRRSALCLQVRLELGFASMYAADLSPGVELHVSPAMYGQGLVGLEGRRVLSVLEGVARLELGWAEGAVFYGFEEKVSSFDGIVAALSLGIRYR